MITRLYPWHKLLKFWKRASRNGNKQTLELMSNCTKQSRWCWSDHQWPVWRWLSELTVLFPKCSLSFVATKTLLHWLLVQSWGWRGRSGQSALDRCLPPPLSCWHLKYSKLSFPINLACLAWLWAASSQTLHTLAVTGVEWGGRQHWRLTLELWGYQF